MKYPTMMKKRDYHYHDTSERRKLSTSTTNDEKHLSSLEFITLATTTTRASFVALAA